LMRTCRQTSINACSNEVSMTRSIQRLHFTPQYDNPVANEGACIASDLFLRHATRKI
jgi:hypothetical protein